MGQEIVKRLARRAGDAGFDAVVAMSLENATYTAGFAVPSQALGNRSRLVMAIVTADQVDMIVDRFGAAVDAALAGCP